MTGSPLFPFRDPDDFRRLREELAGANYNDGAIAELLGVGLGNLREKKLPVVLRRTRGGSPLETLVRLFVLGVPVGVAAARSALPALAPEWFAERGVVRVDGDRVEATVQLRCYQGLIVAFDFLRRHGEALSPEFVMGISPSSLTLGGLTIRRPNQAALDLGTGSGFQAFLAAQHSERVVATDKNPRAVEIARFNVALNNLSQVECREGDLFEPVAGERFDLIVSNPPFIISPDNVYFFLHSGMTGDEVCRRIAREAAGYLTPGGFCQYLANWTEVAGEDWRDRLAGWCEGTGCDAVVLRRASQPPDEYAAIWIETEGGEAEFAKSFDTWMDYYQRLGVASVSSGLVTLRRSEHAEPWFWAEETPETMTFPAGGDLLRAFEAQDFLRAASDEAVLAARFRVSTDVRLDQQSRPTDEGWQSVTTLLRRDGGLHWSGGIDLYGAEMLGGCDGTRTIGELLDDLAAAAEVDWGDQLPTWVAIVRRLTERGFLVPVTG
ncbi:MAG: methyltransferase [Acidimicrobiales bacterium]